VVEFAHSHVMRFLGIFVVGTAIGVSIMLVLEGPSTDPAKAIDAITTSAKTRELPEPNAELRAVTLDSIDGTVGNGPTPGDLATALSADAAVVDSPIRIPSRYRDLVGPLPGDQPSSSELHALFENEPRDEPWAYAMETGINDHIATYGAGEATVVEYVECRSRFCEIGGFESGDNAGGFSSTYGDMRRSGWWQAEGGSNYILGGQAEGGSRFVIIISRYGREQGGADIRIGGWWQGSDSLRAWIRAYSSPATTFARTEVTSST